MSSWKSAIRLMIGMVCPCRAGKSGGMAGQFGKHRALVKL
jgi:hypothetical protein